MRRALGALLLCALFGGGQANATEDARLTQVWSYLETLPSVTARFVQQDPDGKLKKGWLAVSPPGRARIEYEPPDNAVLVADGVFLVYHNPDAGQTAHFSLDKLPLRVLFEGRRPTADDNLGVLQVAERNGYLAVRIAALDDDGVPNPGLGGIGVPPGTVRPRRLETRRRPAARDSRDPGRPDGGRIYPARHLPAVG